MTSKKGLKVQAVVGCSALCVSEAPPGKRLPRGAPVPLSRRPGSRFALRFPGGGGGGAAGAGSQVVSSKPPQKEPLALDQKLLAMGC